MIITALLALMILVLIIWLVNTLIPIPSWLKSVISIILVLIVVIWLFQTIDPSAVRLR